MGVRVLPYIRTILESHVNQLRPLPLSIQLPSDRDQRVDLPLQVVIAAEPDTRPRIWENGDAGVETVLQLARCHPGRSWQKLLETEHRDQRCPIDGTTDPD